MPDRALDQRLAAAEERLAQAESRLEAQAKELRIQFQRIAQLQALVDEMRAASKNVKQFVQHASPED